MLYVLVRRKEKKRNTICRICEQRPPYNYRLRLYLLLYESYTGCNNVVYSILAKYLYRNSFVYVGTWGHIFESMFEIINDRNDRKIKYFCYYLIDYLSEIYIKKSKCYYVIIKISVWKKMFSFNQQKRPLSLNYLGSTYSMYVYVFVYNSACVFYVLFILQLDTMASLMRSKHTFPKFIDRYYTKNIIRYEKRKLFLVHFTELL